MLVRDVMTRKVSTLRPTDTVADAVDLLRRKGFTGAPVAEKGRLVGIVTEFDILNFIELHEYSGLWLPAPFDFIEAVLKAKQEEYEVLRDFEKLRKGRVSDVMTRKVVTAPPDMHVTEAADVMTEGKFTMLPVVEKGRLVGVVTRTDVVRSLSKKR